MDKLVIIRVLPDADSLEGTLGGDVMRLLTGDDGSRYVAMVDGKIVLGDRAHAIRYRLITDGVEGQIAEVKMRYGVTWVAEECEG